MSALPQEQEGLRELLQRPQSVRHAGRDIWQGEWHGQRVVLALSGIGKVAAATTAAALIERFGVTRLVFTGVAGGLGPGVAVGDVVVAHDFVQHDMDASPLFARYEVPQYGQSRFAADPFLSACLSQAAHLALASPAAGLFAQARVHHGLIASGDCFVASAPQALALSSALASAGHNALAVEMEGAAVAQVCRDYGLPFAAARTISDRADDSAPGDFLHFMEHTARHYAQIMMPALLNLLSKK